MTSVELELAKLLVTTLATGVAAYYAIKIAASQRDIARRQAETASEAKKVAEAKLNLDLFEERYALFVVVWTFLSNAGASDKLTGLNPEFTNLIPKAQFLFGKEIADYMREASTRSIALASARRIHNERGYSPEHSPKISENEEWFLSQAIVCYERFGNYLDFSAWRVGTAKVEA